MDAATIDSLSREAIFLERMGVRNVNESTPSCVGDNVSLESRVPQMGACTSSTLALRAVAPPQDAPKPPSRRRKQRIPKTLKRAVWDTYVGVDKGTAPCLCCERTSIRQLEFHCGHVISEARGGTTTVENMRPICAQCNLSMGTQNLFDFKARYFPASAEAPVKPKRSSKSQDAQG
jgi:hypothetical protein